MRSLKMSIPLMCFDTQIRTRQIIQRYFRNGQEPKNWKKAAYYHTDADVITQSAHIGMRTKRINSFIFTDATTRDSIKLLQVGSFMI